MLLALNGNQVLLLHLNHLAHFGDKQTQDAVLKLGVDVLLLDLIPHIEAAAAGADEAFPAQIPLVLNAVVVRLLHCVELMQRYPSFSSAERFSLWTPGRSMSSS